MNIIELVREVRGSNEKLFGQMPERRAEAIVRAVLREIGQQVDGLEEGHLMVPGFGRFIAKQVPDPKTGVPVRRVLFRRAPAVGKREQAN